MHIYRYDTRYHQPYTYKIHTIGQIRFWSREIDLGPTQFANIRRMLVLQGDL